jgi:hypothetical protein
VNAKLPPIWILRLNHVHQRSFAWDRAASIIEIMVSNQELRAMNVTLCSQIGHQLSFWKNTAEVVSPPNTLDSPDLK